MSLPINANSPVEDIRLIQERLGVAMSGKWDGATVAAVKAVAVRSKTGDPVGKAGTHVNARMFNQASREFFASAPGPHNHDGRYLKSVTGVT